MTHNHVIGVGLPRTGTTTLIAALRILGIPKEQIHVGDQMNLPPNRYRSMADIYPQGKFIYTKRKTAETWLNSVRSRTEVIKNNPAILRNREIMYGSSEVISDIYLPVYYKREVEVLSFFQKKYSDEYRDRLLIVCWEQNSSEENWRLLANFLSLPVPEVEFPHRNKTNQRNELEKV